MGLALLIVGLAGCRSDREQALKELERRGVAPVSASVVEAVKTQNAGLLDFLQKAEVKVAPPAAGEPSILHLASARKDWPQVGRLMVFCSPEVVNHAGPGGQGILEQVVQADEFTLAKGLLSAGALPAQASAGADALVIHAKADADTADRLLAALPPAHEALGPALVRFAAAGDAPRVQRLIDQKAPLTTPSKDGTALDMACAGGHADIVRSLIKAGASPLTSPASLGHAVARKDLPLARLLFESGAKSDTPLAPGPDAKTGLAAALASGEIAMVKLFLEHGADRGLCQDHAFTKGDAPLLDLLLEQGLQFDRPGPDGNPPLVRAAIEGHVELIKKLLAKGAPLDQPGALAQDAYHMAVIHRKNDAVAALLAAGAPPDGPFLKPAPPELLPLFGSDYFMKFFKKDEGLTPVMLAAARGDTVLLQQLLAAGAKRGTQTKEWHRYPVQFACDTTNITAAQILLGRKPEEETVKRRAVISLSRQRVTLYQDDKPVRSSRVSTGKRSTPTPPGKYVITDKQVNWISSIYNVPMPFFMRLSCKEIGMHAGVLPGYPASHGCIRMPRGDVQAFFRLLKIGDPVTIEP
jgi:ankyrin repeat protein